MYPVGIINPSLISMKVYQLGGAPCPTAGGGGINAVSVSDNKLHKVYLMEAEQALLCVLASRRISLTHFVHVAHWFMAVSAVRLSVFISFFLT